MGARHTKACRLIRLKKRGTVALIFD